MSYGLVFKILMTVTVVSLYVAWVMPARFKRARKPLYAISLGAAAANYLAFFWMH